MSELRFDDRAVILAGAGRGAGRRHALLRAATNAVVFAEVPEERALCARHPVGVDARILMVANRLLSSKALHRVTRLAMGLPRPGALSSASSKES